MLIFVFIFIGQIWPNAIDDLLLSDRSGRKEDKNIMNEEQRKSLVLIIISALVTVAVILAERKIEPSWYVSLVLYLIPYLLLGFDVLKEAFEGITEGEIFDEDFLMAVATIGAITLKDYKEAVAVMLFFRIGEFFEDYAVDKSRDNIAALMDIRPDYANIMKDGAVVKVNPNEVEVGSIIIVNPGEKVPIDGIITEGSTTLDTSSLTGESVPKTAQTGDEVISGCINMTGSVKIKTTKEFGESTVSKILDLVENASSQKSRSENFISKFARYYTPVVCISALALAVIPPIARLITGMSPEWMNWIYRGLTFLVISCPCALVISIPLTFFAGIGAAGKKGILVKGSNYLEALSKLYYVILDKTGTVTQGVFEVTGIHHNELEDAKLLEIAAHAESRSMHPIAKSIVRAYGKKVDSDLVTQVEEIAGYGISAIYAAQKVLIGSSRLMRENSIEYKECHSSGTIIHMAIDGEYAGHIVISDVVKAEAHEALKELKKAGVYREVMLTGDSQEVAAEVSNMLGIDEYYANLLPGDKVSKLEEFLEKKDKSQVLAFVGDGVNDAPVLTRADVGIAMGALGSDAAIEAADVVLMDDNPMKIASAVKTARKTMRIVYENIGFALAVKAACLILGAFGVANMWLAIFADVGVMVIAVLNAIRALKA